jgi:rSAM/selenodomain-associated transferase 1
MNNKNALIIIAKSPQKGSVKTRLTGHMSDKKILSLYTQLLENTIEKLKEVSGTDTFIAYPPESSKTYFLQFGLTLIPLTTNDLGSNMCHAFMEVFHKGYKKAALVGADIPELSASIVLRAFDELSEKDIVFGPAEDGGYYLVGMKKMIRAVFEDIPWSTDQTLKRSIEQATRFGYSTGLTHTLHDIDTIEDVKQSGYLM